MMLGGRKQHERSWHLVDWVSVDDKLPKFHGIVDVKRSDCTCRRAYFHADKMSWAHNYRKFPWSHWQDKKTLEWLEDVTHWRSNEVG